MAPHQTEEIVIALDAMGGDNAPNAVLHGADAAGKKYPSVKFLIFGDKSKINPILDKLEHLRNISHVTHTDQVISNDEKPSTALRQGKESSMGLAVNAVKEGKANGAISSGNTGALMAISKLALRTLPGIDRPAIATAYPTMRGKIVVLDLGANIECTAEQLFQFAVMGDAFARAVLEVDNPSIGLLNVGSEEVKGNESVKNAASLLKESNLNLNFYGYVEGDDITKGTTDVVVSDGFSGNISLKTAEGTAQMVTHFLRMAFKSTLMSKIGYLFAKPALKRVFYTLDPRMHNGAMFLGLNGIIVKSHGGTDEIGFENAVNVAIELVANKINDQITKEIEISHQNQNATGTED